jgi:uncharacterized protein (DUF2237 family)
MGKATNYNLFDDHLEICSLNPITGFTRNGYCDTNEHDKGYI